MQNKKLRQSYEELQAIVGTLQQESIGLRQVQSGNAEVLAAIVSLLGEQSVQSEMERLRQERQDAAEAQMAAGVQVLAEAGVLKTLAETVQGALVVGVDTNADGRKRRVQFELKEAIVPGDILPKFIGKKVGDVVVNNGVSLTITEIYEIDKARAAEFQREQQEKARAAALPQQAEAPSAEAPVAAEELPAPEAAEAPQA
jgi:ssDNA-binding replication factor A large subunit